MCDYAEDGAGDSMLTSNTAAVHILASKHQAQPSAAPPQLARRVPSSKPAATSTSHRGSRNIDSQLHAPGKACAWIREMTAAA